MSLTHTQSRRKHPVRKLLASPLMKAVTTPHGIDHYLSALHPRWSVGDVRATITAKACRTPDTVTLTIKPNWNWAGFKAGQFVQLRIEIDGVQRMRCFSPANSVYRADGQLELTIKIQERGLVTTYLADHAAAGTHCGLSQAMGEFYLPDARPEHVLLISGGSGITPVLAMLRTLVDEQHSGQIDFVHYARSPDALPDLEALETLEARHPSLRLHVIYTRGTRNDQGRASSPHFTAAQIDQLVPDHADAEVFACGPAALLEAVSAHWATINRAERLHMERFTAAQTPSANSLEAVDGDVTFQRSERFALATAEPLLDQAEAAGLRPEFGCRMGICASCTCRKVSGTVRNVQTGVISAEPDEDIRLCISAPVGAVTLDL